MKEHRIVTKSSEDAGSGAPALRKNAGIVEKRGDENVQKVRWGNPGKNMQRVFPGLPNELLVRFWMHEENQKQWIPQNIQIRVENSEARAFQDAIRIANGAKKGKVRPGMVDSGFNTKFKRVRLSKYPNSFTEEMKAIGFYPTALNRSKRNKGDTVEIVTIRFKLNGARNSDIAKDVEQLTSLGAENADYWENPLETKLENGRPVVTRVDTMNLKFIVGQKTAKSFPVLSPKKIFALAQGIIEQ